MGVTSEAPTKEELMLCLGGIFDSRELILAFIY